MIRISCIFIHFLNFICFVVFFMFFSLLFSNPSHYLFLECFYCYSFLHHSIHYYLMSNKIIIYNFTAIFISLILFNNCLKSIMTMKKMAFNFMRIPFHHHWVTIIRYQNFLYILSTSAGHLIIFSNKCLARYITNPKSSCYSLGSYIHIKIISSVLEIKILIQGSDERLIINEYHYCYYQKGILNVFIEPDW